MTYRKRKKDTRLRASHTHGCGAKNKRRGTGNRGGKGRGGSGKRAQSKKPSFWKEGRWRSLGFFSKSRTESKAINVGDVNLMIEHNKFSKKGSQFDVNLTELGYTKLLSKGRIKHPAIITITTATDKAVAKTLSAGGKVNLQTKTVEKIKG